MTTIQDPTSADPGNRGRRSRLVAALRQEGARGVLVATASTLALLVLIVSVVTHSPYWPEVRQSFFNGEEFRASLPDIVVAFRRNVYWFLIAEPIILAWALLLAILRSCGARCSSRCGCSRRSTSISSAGSRPC